MGMPPPKLLYQQLRRFHEMRITALLIGRSGKNQRGDTDE
jgi:hypothetical protein